MSTQQRARAVFERHFRENRLSLTQIFEQAFEEAYEAGFEDGKRAADSPLSIRDRNF